jgi:hypothetical protein
MSEETNRLVLSKKGQRQVTPFTGNELLYDYLSGVLDEERKKAVEAHLESSREAQLDFQKIQIGLQYAEKLKNISVSPPLQEKLGAPSSYFTVLFQKSRFDQWPVGLKWGLEAIVIVFVIVTALSLAPWEKVLNLRLATNSNDVVLTELNRTNSNTKVTDESTAPATVETPQFVDEDIKAKETKPTKNANATPGVKAAGVAAVVAGTPAPVTKPTAPAPKPPPAKVAAKEEEGEETESGGKASGGFLYRGKIAVTNVEAIGPKIKDKIIELGGRKAGEVELGWQKTPDSAYFHFTIPEAKYEELQTFLAGYGTARIDKEKHPRVMHDGIIRLIITVDEAQK